MTVRSIVLGWIAVGVSAFAFASGPALAEPDPGLDRHVEALMGLTGVPGAAVTIVENGRVTHARGYGVRRLGGTERVDADTLFQLGSMTKAMTSAALAVLVDDGKLEWNDRVIDHMPEFQMYDPWTTREMTVLDLLSHRSGLGLGAGDLLFVPNTTFTRDEIVRQLRYIPPATSFRSGYAYDNVLYIAAGRLVEKISGQPWETFVEDRLLRPAGMTSSTTGNAERFATANRTYPHARLDGVMRGVGDQEALDEQAAALGSNGAPAGAVSASADDLGRWIQVQLGQGLASNGTRIFSEASSETMWSPQALIPIPAYPPELGDAAPSFNSYALGWDVRDYRGHRILAHGGAVFGALSYVVLIPDLDVGFAIVLNSEDDVFYQTLTTELLDHYLGFAPRDWYAAWTRLHDRRVEAATAELAARETIITDSRGPTLALGAYAATYSDSWYGPISITHDGGRLIATFPRSPGMVGELRPWRYDTFKVVWRDEAIEPALFTFALDAGGKIDRLTLEPASPLADFSYDYHDLTFRPVGAP